MQYGDWELREDAVYYPAQNVIMYPSSNSADEGSLHLESNVRSIVRRITKKSYKLSDNAFHVTLNSDGKSLNVTSGEANISGYHLIANRNLTISIPNTTSVTPLTLGMCLSYDAANNVTGDVVNYDGEDGETFSGVYLKFFDECNVQHKYDSILMLARVWVKDGTVVSNYQIPETDTSLYSGWYIENGIENDPFNDHAVYADKIEVRVNGVNLNCFDAIPVIHKTTSETVTMDDGSTKTLVDEIPNLTDVSKYENMYYELEHDPLNYTKAPTFTTDVQDFINYVPDWYVSKYGDYMTGGLRFDNLSYDAKRMLDPDYAVEYSKDHLYASKSGKYHNTFGVLISPRDINSIHHSPGTALDVDAVDKLYENGGTIMTVIPKTYSGLLQNEGAAMGAYAALVSQSANDSLIGLKIQGQKRPDNNLGVRRVTNIGHTTTSNAPATEHFRITHFADPSEDIYSAFRSEIRMDDKDILLHASRLGGGNIQLMSSQAGNQIAFQVTPNGINVVNNMIGDNIQWVAPDSISTIPNKGSNLLISTGYGGEASNHVELNVDTFCNNYYAAFGNLAILSSTAGGTDININSFDKRVETVGLINVPGTEGLTASSCYRDVTQVGGTIPYIRVIPGVYTNRLITEDYILVGTSRRDDMVGGNAIDEAVVKTVIGKAQKNSSAIIEQTASDYAEITYNKISTLPSAATRTAKQGYGIFTIDTIGASTAELTHLKNVCEPYTSDTNWVRFTRFGYNKDLDMQYLGDAGIAGVGNDQTATNSHALEYGGSYNIEFNTTYANQRTSQIIWHYKNGENSKHQPLTLSYIHDEDTTYPNEVYYDHNLYRHQNPTYGVRDFLRIDGGGLSIHGDVNNPTLPGDANNSSKHLGITLVHGRVYSANYNDYAETYEKANKEQEAIIGAVVMLDEETGNYKICNEEESGLVVGVISENYGMLIGGPIVDTETAQIDCTMQLNQFTVGVSGKVPVLIEGDIRVGDLLVSAATEGYAKAVDKKNIVPGTIIGKVVSKPFTKDGKQMCMMQIMLA